AETHAVHCIRALWPLQTNKLSLSSRGLGGRRTGHTMALLVRIYFNAVFGALGGLLGWMLFGVFGDQLAPAESLTTQMLLGGAFIGGAIGYFVVSVDAIRDRNPVRFARLAAYGVVIGAAGGAAGMLIGDWVNFRLVGAMGARQVLGAMLARGLGWTFLGVA